MALDPAANFVRGTTDADVDDTQTTVSVDDASIFPDPSTDGEFNVVIWDAANFPRPDQDADVEVLRVTAIDTETNDLTVVRGQEGTSASTHPSGSAVHLSPTAKMFSDIDSQKLGDGENFDGQGTSEFTNLASVSTDRLNNADVTTAEEGDVLQKSSGSDLTFGAVGGGGYVEGEPFFTKEQGDSTDLPLTINNTEGYDFVVIDVEIRSGSGGTTHLGVDAGPSGDLAGSWNWQTGDGSQSGSEETYCRFASGGTSRGGLFTMRIGPTQQIGRDVISVFSHGASEAVTNVSTSRSIYSGGTSQRGVLEEIEIQDTTGNVSDFGPLSARGGFIDYP